MSSSISPGQMVRLTFLISWMNFEGAGIKHVTWRDWSNSLLVLFIRTIILAACDC